jgi:pimeloyl-ACP methyl ester carboxylesterase
MQCASSSIPLGRHLLLLLLLALPAPGQEPLVLTEALVLPPVRSGGRTVVRRDLLGVQWVQGTWTTPGEGDALQLPDGTERTWRRAQADEQGWLQDPALRGGAVLWTVTSLEGRVAVLEAAGHARVLVNGVPRTGDPYAHGFVALPVQLRAGDNELLFTVSRGKLRARLVSPVADLWISDRDLLLPHAVVGQPLEAPGAVVLVNATGDVRRGLVLRAAVAGGSESQQPVPPLPPLGVYKMPFLLRGPVPAAPEPIAVTLQVGDAAGEVARTTCSLDVRQPDQARRETFTSAIDGSTQCFGLRPAVAHGEPAGRPGVVLSLHGAGVGSLGQARAYASKHWCHVVAPTNRRRYGFDWEDWGRLDALEVLDVALERLAADPTRVHLTGHSMGGHGTWHLGVTYPDRFATVNPSAGWISFWSYAGGQRPGGEDAVAELLGRVAGPSDTLQLVRNLEPLGVYVLHGAEDDNVPVEQARRMREVLSGFHRDFRYHEEPGQGHWWNVSDEPGTDCVDWPPMFDNMARHVRPAAVREVDFRTANPGVSASCHWATVVAQTRLYDLASVGLRLDPVRRRIRGQTDNVARLQLDLRGLLTPGEPVSLELDGGAVEAPWRADGLLPCQRDGDGWTVVEGFPAADKRPGRYGLFRSAFTNRPLLVVGTGGTPAERTWAWARARYDAETFWYRGNGSFPVVADTELDLTAAADRNLILYGNRETHRLWDTLLGDSPVQVTREHVILGEHAVEGEDLVCLLVRPHPRSQRTLVAAVAPTGSVGARLSWWCPYFVSGIAYPDCTVLSAAMLEQGAVGVRAVASFGLDWTLAAGELALR